MECVCVCVAPIEDVVLFPNEVLGHELGDVLNQPQHENQQQQQQVSTDDSCGRGNRDNSGRDLDNSVPNGRREPVPFIDNNFPSLNEEDSDDFTTTTTTTTTTATTITTDTNLNTTGTDSTAITNTDNPVVAGVSSNTSSPSLSLSSPLNGQNVNNTVITSPKNTVNRQLTENSWVILVVLFSLLSLLVRKVY